MFSGRFGRGRRISWGEQEKQRRSYLRQLDDDRDEVQRAAQDQRRSQLFVHGDPQNLDTVIGGPRMWERRGADPDFLDVRLGIGVQQASESAVSLQWPDVPDRGRARTGNRRCAKGFHPRAEQDSRDRQGAEPAGEARIQLHRRRSERAAQSRPRDHVLPRGLPQPQRPQAHGGHPASRVVVLAGVAPHNQHDEMFDACGLRRLVFTSPTELEEALDAELHRKGRGPWTPPVGASPTSMPSPMESSSGLALGPHWVIVDDNVGTPGAVGGRNRAEGHGRHHRVAAGDPDRRRRRIRRRQRTFRPA